MKLQNKDSGEIGKLLKLQDNDDDLEVMTDNKCYRYKTLAEVAKYWEDYEEPKGQIMSIDRDGMIVSIRYSHYEEAEKAIEKLKAWVRLKAKGFRFTGLGVDNYEIDDIKYEMKEPPITHDCQEMKDLKLLFGGKDE